jgi:hypothetical protein
VNSSLNVKSFDKPSKDEVKPGGDIAASPHKTGSRKRSANVIVESDSSGDSSGNETDHYEVEKIVERKLELSVYKYLLKWKGYPPSQNTWQFESDLNCPKLLDDFLKRIGASGERTYDPSETI